MVIYVEYVSGDNLVIGSLILLSTAKISREKTTKVKIFLSSLLGTAFAFLTPILNFYVGIIIKLLVAVVMVLIAFSYQDRKKFFANLIIFFLTTFVYGGACLGIAEIFGVKMLYKNGIIYEYKFPVGVILLICAITYYSLKNIINYSSRRNVQNKFLFEAKIWNGKEFCTATAFWDTGNKLTSNGSPITIINYKIFSQLFPNIGITDLLKKKKLT